MEKRKLTIVQVLPELEEGGVEGETVDLAIYLSQKGHNSIVVSGGGRLVSLLEKAGCTHINWPYIGEKSIRCLKYIQPLKKYLVDNKVDVLHLRSRLPAWIGYLSWKMLPQDERPALITTFHGFYSVNAYSTIMTKGERVIAVSQTIKDHILENYNVSPGKMDLIHGGYDEEYFSPKNIDEQRIDKLRQKWQIKNGVPVILLPGRLTFWKGQETFIDSLASLKEHKFLAICAGEIDETSSYTKKIRDKIKKHNLEGKVLLTGHCDDMPAALQISDIVVSASSSQPEAFGKVAIEAMAMRKLIIATAHGGSLETVVDGQTGWLVPPSNAEKMALALRESLDNLELSKEMGIRGEAWVRKNFTAQRMCEKTIQLYNRTLQKKEDLSSGKILTVVQILPELEGGGVERGTLEMGNYLAQKGHRSIVVSGGGRMVAQLEAEKTQHISLKVGSKSPRALLYIRPLRQLLLKENVDVLHLRSRMPGWIGYLAWKSLPAEKRPVLVTTFHGFYSVNSYSAIMTKGMGIIAVSESIRTHIKNYYNVGQEVKLIFRGVDGELFNMSKVDNQRIASLKNKWGITDSNDSVIMLPGRITRLKGQDVFLRSLALLKNKSFKAILVGDVTENPGLAAELDAIVKENGLQSKVTFVGHCDDMPAAYAIADVVISASSSNPEAFGRTTVEAMAMGKPVIATAHGGSLETVVPGITGWLVKPSDAVDMAKALDNYLGTSEKERLNIGMAGQKRVAERYTTDSMCSETISFYRKLIDTKKAE